MCVDFWSSYLDRVKDTTNTVVIFIFSFIIVGFRFLPLSNDKRRSRPYSHSSGLYSYYSKQWTATLTCTPWWTLKAHELRTGTEREIPRVYSLICGRVAKIIHDHGRRHVCLIGDTMNEAKENYRPIVVGILENPLWRLVCSWSMTKRVGNQLKHWPTFYSTGGGYDHDSKAVEASSEFNTHNIYDGTHGAIAGEHAIMQSDQVKITTDHRNYLYPQLYIVLSSKLWWVEIDYGN